MDDLEKTIKGLKCCTKKPYPKNREKWGVKKEPECDDCPNRYTGLCEYCLMRDALELLKEKQPKKGEWIITGRKNVYGGIEIKCPFCNDTVMVQFIEDELFCRHCGADMRKDGDPDASMA